MTTPFHEMQLRAPKRIGLLLGAGASRPLGLPLMTDLIPPDFRASLGDADQEVVFDMAFNWSMAQHPTSLDFEVLYTAVDTLGERLKTTVHDRVGTVDPPTPFCSSEI